MKSLTFNKSSWHYLLATKIGNYDPPRKYEDSDELYGDSGDICTYTRHVLLGALLLTLVGVIIACVGFALWHFIFGIIFSLLCGCYMFSDLGTIVLVVGSIFALSVGFFKSVKAIGEWNYNRKMDKRKNYVNRPPKPDGFMKHAYKSWKGKFCVQIEFKE